MTRPSRRQATAKPIPIMALAVVALSALALIISPRPPSLGDESTGDRALAAQVRQAAGGGPFRGLSVALIERGTVRTAGVGVTGGPGSHPVDAATPYEIGSITKTMTGMLLADSKLPPDTPIRTLLPKVAFDDRALADATLAEYASHRAGLPRVPLSPRMLVMSYLSNIIGLDPYAGVGPGVVLGDLAGSRASEQGKVSYSNIGMASLGLALADHAGLPYGRLLRERILGPLGMTATAALGQDQALPAGRAYGSKANGMAMDPWRGDGYNPAGVGVWSTAADLAKLVKGVMDGTAPGADAATPRFQGEGKERIGYAWYTTVFGDRTVTWHNGGTGGFRGFVGFDRQAGRGVVVLGNTDGDLDPVGLRLLNADPADRTDSPPWLMLVITLILTFSPGLEAWFGTPPHELTRAVRKVLWGAFSLLLAWVVGPWAILPPVLWALGAGLLLGCAAIRWSRAPYAPSGVRTWVGLAIPAVIIGACLIL
ncbi:MAG: beta-lactamase family protein [Nonomuraea sp.]|nr:beta-lactamase family protein [Nonomuraea sp.]